VERGLEDRSRSEIEAAINEWIVGRNAERNRAILRRRLLDGICYEPLAEEFDLSVRQVKDIVYKAQDRLYKHMSG
jgi:DNA-directed RNA polymerase specialized sigma24 family protein